MIELSARPSLASWATNLHKCCFDAGSGSNPALAQKCKRQFFADTYDLWVADARAFRKQNSTALSSDWRSNLGKTLSVGPPALEGWEPGIYLPVDEVAGIGPDYSLTMHL